MRRTLMLLSGFALGCSGAVGEPVEAEPSGTSAPAPEPVLEMEQVVANIEPSDWLDVEAMSATFAGAQVVGGRQAVAWNVEGSTVQVDDGSGPVERTLEFRSPCTLSLKNEEAGSATIHVYAVGEGVRYLGLGSAGVLVGEDTIVACAGGKVYVVELEDAVCATWKERFGRWVLDEPEPICTFENQTLTIGRYVMERIAPKIYGTSQFAGAQIIPHADFAAAQAAL